MEIHTRTYNWTIKIHTKHTQLNTKTMKFTLKTTINKKITYSYTSYTYTYTPIYPTPILFYAYLPHRDHHYKNYYEIYSELLFNHYNSLYKILKQQPLYTLYNKYTPFYTKIITIHTRTHNLHKNNLNSH